MIKFKWRKIVMLLAATYYIWFIFQSELRADEDDNIVAISSKSSDDYIRSRRPTGALEVETYAFGNGGFCGGASNDKSIDRLKFLDVAQTIAPSLASQNYIPSREPKTTKLLIMVYWGTTSGASGAADTAAYQNLVRAQSPNGIDDAVLAMALMENHIRDSNNVKNARILGFNEELVSVLRLRGTALEFRWRDLVNEIEDGRYFVVLMAYDFQILANQKKHKLLWETRFSVPEGRHDFAKDLWGMSQNAAIYFGQNSHGLTRKALPTGSVKIGPIKSLGPIKDSSGDRK